MKSVVSAIKSTVPISVFNRGLAGKVFEEVRNTGAKVVMKNNVAECVLLSPKEYVELIDELEDLRMIALAQDRLTRMDPSALLAEEEVWRKLGITEKELDDLPDPEFE